MVFTDRVDAGRRLGAALRPFADADVVVVGLPRGGVPVAFEVARALDAPLDVVVVRKLGVPFQPELAMGAVGEGGARVLDNDVLRSAGVGEHDLADVEQRERAEVERRARSFRGDRPRVPLRGRTVIVVDDGIATGSTARAACQVVRTQGAARVVLAVPVAPAGIEERMRPDADEVICLSTPRDFYAVGQFYVDFSQVDDTEVERLLAQANSSAAEVTVPAGPVQLAGQLTVPDGALGVVAFAHGSGSSRHSPRNRFVAAELNAAGFATLLFDLLTVSEERDRANVFDIELLSRRLLAVTEWLRTQPAVGALPIGYFGASTGAAAALWAAADPAAQVAAVVSRGGRPDLAGEKLALVRAPTLLIVGGADDVVIELNRQAQAQLTCVTRLEIVPGATHLFEEPGALEHVAQLACRWFTDHL